MNLEGLRRITSDGNFIPQVDGFRLLAIALVIFDHIHGQIANHVGIAWPALLSFADGGRRGVEFFFIISGFILGLPFARRALSPDPLRTRRPFSYRAYLLRRVTRLEPPFVLSLLLRLGLIVIVFREDFRQLLPHFLASLLYSHNLVFGTMSRISPPTWSLEVEVQFYLLAPLLARVFRISHAGVRRSLLIGATVLFCVLAEVYFADIERYHLSVLGNAQYFFAGFLLCEFYFATSRLRAVGYLLDLTAMALLLPLLYSDGLTVEILFPFGALVVFCAGLRGVLLPRLFGLTIISITGGMCYSIYLTHGTVLAAIGTAWSKLPLGSLPLVAQQLLMIGICAIAVLAVGTAYFVSIERPCMDPRWPGKLMSRLVSIGHSARQTGTPSASLREGLRLDSRSTVRHLEPETAAGGTSIPSQRRIVRRAVGS
jgi:peptidoglycan/LPS O-acetylase OafA/YrhL